MDLVSLTGITVLSLSAVFVLLERYSPARVSKAPIGGRWVTNLGLLLLGGVLTSIFFPYNIADIAADLPAGVVRDLSLPLALETLLILLIMDCFAYWEHRVFHEVRWMWRLHLVHHSDTAIDVTTGQRHHPVEKLVAVLFGLLFLFALGFSFTALMLYLLLAQLWAVFSHANIRLPSTLDATLRKFLVTPSVHRVHHSSLQFETDSNYGGILTIWDRLFGTYTPPEQATLPAVGLEYFREKDDAMLIQVLLQPLRSQLVSAPQNNTSSVSANPPVAALGLSAQWRNTIGYSAAALFLCLLAFWPSVVHLALLWSKVEAYQYAWFILPVFVYIAGWYHREAFLAQTPKPNYAGALVIFAAAALWFTAMNADFKLGQHVAIVVAIQGVLFAALGVKIYRSWLPLMFLFLGMIPCGDVMQPLLRDLTLKWIEWFAILTGLPYVVDGYYVMVGEHEYVVLNGCSGLRFFTLGGFLGYVFGLLLFPTLGRVVALAALGAALGVLTNAARVCLIVLTDQVRGTQMDIAGHTDIQWLVWFLSLGLLLYIASQLARDSWAPAEK